MLRRTLLPSALLLASACFSGYSDERPDRRELRVREGAFARDLVLTGELEAGRGETLACPSIPQWQTAIKWLAEDGSAVKQGERVVELDNSALTNDLDARRQTLTQVLQELQQREAEWTADLKQKELDVEKRASELEKARLDAEVPADILSTREYENRQLALQRGKTELAKAIDVLAAQRKAVVSDRGNLLLRIEKARREIAVAEEAIEALVLRAPRDGIVVVKDIPWEGRKLQTGDAVWVGFAIAILPDLSTLRVNARLVDVDDGRIAPGMPVDVVLDGYPGQRFSGRVESISAVAQDGGRPSLRRYFDVIVALDRVDHELMRPGLSARVTVHGRNVRSALLAPRGGLDLTGETPVARLAGGTTREVKLGECNAQDCIVLAGLEKGERLAAQ